MNQKFYDEIKNILSSARNKVYQTANFAMVEAYWNIGKSIIEEFWKRIYRCELEKYATVLFNISKWLRTA